MARLAGRGSGACGATTAGALRGVGVNVCSAVRFLLRGSEVKGLTWLPTSLEHELRESTRSSVFSVIERDGDSRYYLAFSPHSGSLSDSWHLAHEGFDCPETTRGTLALVRKTTAYGATLDTTFFVKGPRGDFVQWGERSRKAYLGDSEEESSIIIGPDLGSEASGVMGLSFDELLRSEWVQDDSIVFKVCIQEIACDEIDHAELAEGARSGRPVAVAARWGCWDWV